MTGTADGADVEHRGKTKTMYDLLASSAGKTDLAALQRYYSDDSCGICVRSTIDMMVFDTTAREAYLSRGPSYGGDWKRFGFSG